MVNRYVLSCDGGGTKGIITAVALHELSKRTGKHPVDIFDLFIGSSTGGIICALLNTPKSNRDNSPKYTTSDLIEFYTGSPAKEIFKPNPFRLPWESIKYPSNQIEGILKDKFGDVLLKNAIKPLMVTTYDMDGRETLYDTEDRDFLFINSLEDVYKDMKMWQATRGTSAAPTYFEPFGLDEQCLIDGGTFCNNPALFGYVAAKDLYPNDNIIVVSIGTGSTTTPIPYKKARKWNILNWASSIYDISSDGQNDSTDHALKKLLKSNYFRFNMKLPLNLDKMDNADSVFIQQLIDLTNKTIISTWKDKLQKLVELVDTEGRNV